MKALVYTGTHESMYRDEAEPQLAADEAIVAVDAVGVCGSDMHAWHGKDPRRVPPLILGHEAVGTVVQGPGEGRKVVLNPLMTCGHCAYCTTGRANLCAERELIGMRRPGAFAERVSIAARNLIELPDGIDPVLAALTEPCATAWHAIALAERASWRPIAEADCLVIGGGSVGLLAALILKNFGCGRVLLAETNPLRRGTVEAAGIEAFDPIATPADAAAFDIVVDCVGAKATRDASIRSARPGGVVSHVGLLQGDGDFDARTVTLQEITFIGVYTYTDADLRASLAALHRGALGNAIQWVEERPLSDGASAFVDLDRHATTAAKIILRP